jgi:hypothetical protein
MAKYKEERRRQLASQIANRLSSAQSSSSSDEQEDTSSLDKYSKYRRHHRAKQKPELPQPPLPPVASAAEEPVAPPVRRRRRRSVTKESASPTRSPVQSKNLAAQLGDADGEDNEDREDSPEHIYHQIGTDELVKMSKTTTPVSLSLVQSSSRRFRSPERKPVSFDSDQVIITMNSASRKPRFPSKGRTFYPREHAMLARVYIRVCCCCCGGGCFTPLLQISSWLHVKSFIANFVMVASRVVVCRVNIRVDLRRVALIRYARPAV